MGYRSDVTDVTLLVSRKGFKALKEFIGRNNYEDDIGEFEKGLENLEKMNLSYRLGIVREDINDSQ
mgnify:CR=1 FL=1